jgi:hypothetical protein
LVKLYPPQPVVEPSLRRNFQSFSINAMNLGGCLHVTLDDRCLHLQPVKVLRWMGLSEASIPWEAIKLDVSKKTSNRRRPWPHFVKVRIGKFKVTGPAWCFRMISDDLKPGDVDPKR